MNRKQQIEICKTCLYKEFSLKQGIICGKTHSIQTFDTNCDDFIKDKSKQDSIIDAYDKRNFGRVKNNRYLLDIDVADNSVDFNVKKNEVPESKGFWILKSKHDIRVENEKKINNFEANRFKKSLKIFLFGSLFLPILMSILSLVFGENGGKFDFGPPDKVKLSDLPTYLPEYIEISLTISAVMALIFFFSPKLSDKSLLIDSVMCDKCFEAKKDDGVFICSCGGKYHDIRKFKWIEEEGNNG